MSVYLKDPAAILDYRIDWGRDYLLDDTIVAASWTIEPDRPEGLALVASAHGTATCDVTVSGGEPGAVYRVANHIETLSGRHDSRSIVVRVEPR